MTEDERKELQNDLRELMCAYGTYKELLDKVCAVGRRIRQKIIEVEQALDKE